MPNYSDYSSSGQQSTQETSYPAPNNYPTYPSNGQSMESEYYSAPGSYTSSYGGSNGYYSSGSTPTFWSSPPSAPNQQVVDAYGPTCCKII